MERKLCITDIYDLLYRLGVTANYIGFFHMAYAVLLCVKQPDRLLLVTKWLYPEVAKQYHTNWKAVERNIRTVGNIVWRENRPLLEQLARRGLVQKPCTSQLLAILSSSMVSPLPAQGLNEAAVPIGEEDHMGAADGPADGGLRGSASAEGSVPPAENQGGGDCNTSTYIAV